MPEKPHNFWQELKRRKVIRVIIGYLASAYVLLELTSIVAEPLGLPDWTINLVLVLLCIGFVITIVISWIYDFTPKGIEKTKPIKLAEQKEPLAKPSTRKLKISDVVIAVLVVAVVVLAYPRIFKKDRFGDIRDEEGKISLVVMPFENLSRDSLYDGFKLGLQDLLITELSNSDELLVRHTQTMYDFMGNTNYFDYASVTPSIASDIAKKLDANTVIFGSLNTSGNRLLILAKLMNSRTQEIYKSYRIEGTSQDNIFALADSLSLLIKSFLEIRILEQDVDLDTRFFSKTESAEAYRYFSKGLSKFWISDFESASELFISALKLDPDFLWAKIFLLTSYGNVERFVQARQIIDSLYQEIDEYGYIDQLFIHYFKSLYDKNGSEGIEFLQKINAEIPHSRGWWYEAGRYYADQMNQYQSAVEALEKSLEIDQKWGGRWNWMALYSLLGNAYHKTGQHEKEQEIYELGLSINPNYQMIYYRQAVCAFSNGDTLKANEFLKSYRQITENQDWNQIDIDLNIGGIYKEAGQYKKAIAIYEELIDKYPNYPLVKAKLASVLINNEIDVAKGLELIEDALKYDAENYTFLVTKGRGLYKLGHYEKAYKFLMNAWELRPYYNHKHYLYIQEVEKALTNQ